MSLIVIGAFLGVLAIIVTVGYLRWNEKLLDKSKVKDKDPDEYELK